MFFSSVFAVLVWCTILRACPLFLLCVGLVYDLLYCLFCLTTATDQPTTAIELVADAAASAPVSELQSEDKTGNTINLTSDNANVNVVDANTNNIVAMDVGQEVPPVADFGSDHPSIAPLAVDGAAAPDNASTVNDNTEPQPMDTAPDTVALEHKDI